MQTINLYRYKESNGIAISPIKRNETDVPHSFRLVADEGKALTNDNVTFAQCIDVSNTEGWVEVDDPGDDDDPENTDSRVADMEAALDVLGVTE